MEIYGRAEGDYLEMTLRRLVNTYVFDKKNDKFISAEREYQCMVRKNERMFDKTNITPLGISVLTFLSRSPDNEYYVREIAGKVGGSAGGTHGVLRELESMNLIDRRKSGKNVYYRVNSGAAAIPFFKIFITIIELEYMIDSIRDRARKIVLFGSASRGEDTWESDIDLLVITPWPDEVKEYLRKEKVKRKISPVVLSSGELAKLRERDRAFYDEIEKGIILWSENNE